MKKKAALLVILSVIFLSSCNHDLPAVTYTAYDDVQWNITLLENNQCSWNDGKIIHDGIYRQLGQYITITIPLSGNEKIIFYGRLKGNQLTLYSADFNINMNIEK